MTSARRGRLESARIIGSASRADTPRCSAADLSTTHTGVASREPAALSRAAVSQARVTGHAFDEGGTDSAAADQFGSAI